jgi:hypothetical protein
MARARARARAKARARARANEFNPFEASAIARFLGITVSSWATLLIARVHFHCCQLPATAIFLAPCAGTGQARPPWPIAPTQPRAAPPSSRFSRFAICHPLSQCSVLSHADLTSHAALSQCPMPNTQQPAEQRGEGRAGQGRGRERGSIRQDAAPLEISQRQAPAWIDPSGGPKTVERCSRSVAGEASHQRRHTLVYVLRLTHGVAHRRFNWGEQRES